MLDQGEDGHMVNRVGDGARALEGIRVPAGRRSSCAQIWATLAEVRALAGAVLARNGSIDVAAPQSGRDATRCDPRP